MKKTVLLIVIFATLALFSGCSENGNINEGLSLVTDNLYVTAAEETPTAQPQFNIVSTIFPPYDWVREIAGEYIDNFNLSFLTDGGVDLHNFQPSVSDVARISTADMFIYVGGHSDLWVADVLSNAVNPNMIVVNLMDVLGDAVSHHHHGHDCDHDHHHHDHDCDHDHDHHHDQISCGEYDEHVWLSLSFAKTLTAAISDALIMLAPANEDAFRDSLNTYIGKLWTLNAEYEAAVAAASKDTVLFADRFPFYYLLRDYGISHYAAFPGCHAETEASFTTIAFLIERVNDLGLHTILVTESADQSIARTIARDSDNDPQTLVLNSLQSVSARDAQDGVTYLSIMRENLYVLKQALQ